MTLAPKTQRGPGQQHGRGAGSALIGRVAGSALIGQVAGGARGRKMLCCNIHRDFRLPGVKASGKPMNAKEPLYTPFQTHGVHSMATRSRYRIECRSPGRFIAHARTPESPEASAYIGVYPSVEAAAAAAEASCTAAEAAPAPKPTPKPQSKAEAAQRRSEASRKAKATKAAKSKAKPSPVTKPAPSSRAAGPPPEPPPMPGVEQLPWW